MNKTIGIRNTAIKTECGLENGITAYVEISNGSIQYTDAQCNGMITHLDDTDKLVIEIANKRFSGPSIYIPLDDWETLKGCVEATIQKYESVKK